MQVDFTPSGDSLAMPPAKRKEMMSVTKDATGRTVVKVNSSSLDIIQNCLRKAQYSLNEGWRETEEKPSTVFGSAVHSAMEVFYRGSIEKRELLPLEKYEPVIYGHEIPPGLISSAMSAFVSKAQSLATLPDEDKRSLKNGLWILWQYFKRFKDDPYVAYIDGRGPFIERTFTHRIYEDSILAVDLFGTIDFVFRHTTTGALLGGDHKTSSGIMFGGSSFLDREKPNHQYTAYVLGLNAVYGLQVSDFLVNIIEVKAKPKTDRGQPPSFLRQLTSRTESDFEEFTETLMYYVRQYLYALDRNSWPLGPVGSCNAYSGCDFKRVCAAPPSLRNNILTAKFSRT